MAFGEIEASDYFSTADFLYEFQVGGNVYRYTASDTGLSVGGYLWERAAISHEGVRQTGDATEDSVTLTSDSQLIPASIFVGSVPTQDVLVRFAKAHEGDQAFQVFFVGLVSSVDWPEPGRVKFSLITLSATMLREGLTLTFQRSCRNVLYSQGRGACNVNKEDFRVDATVVTTSRGEVALRGLAGYPDGWFDGGFIEWDDSTRGVERRTIERYTGGSSVLLFGLPDGLFEDMEVRVYAGCARTAQACDEKFNNMDNYGGQPQLPGDSPFDGDPLGGS